MDNYTGRIGTTSGGFRIPGSRSPVNFSSGHRNGGGNMAFNPFGNLQPAAALFGTTTFLGTAPNHFNFPLRSAGGAVFLPPPKPSRAAGLPASQIVKNKVKEQQQQQEMASSPQYRIFKRGDNIPGLSFKDLESSDMGSSITSSVAATSKDSGQNKENETNNKNGGPQPPNKTPISQVSDIARFHGLSVEYKLVGEKGPPHNPTFTVVLQLGEEKYTGQGSSIKRAQHAAATEAVEKTELSKPAPRTQPNKRSPFGNSGGKRSTWAVTQLSALSAELNQPLSIVQQPVTIMDPFRRGEPSIIVSVYCGQQIFNGEGPNFSIAKNNAVMLALKGLMKMKQELQSCTDGAGGLVNSENKSPISLVFELAMKRGLSVKFEVTNEEGLPHSKVFTVICTLGSDEATTEGQGATKQAAKRVASELMIQKINEMPTTPINIQSASLKSIQRGLFKQKSQKKKPSAPVVKELDKQPVSPISRLIQIAHIRKYKEPEFTDIPQPGGQQQLTDEALKTMSERDKRNLRRKKPSFTIEVAVGPYSCRGTGPNKKAAKKAASEAALIEMGYGPTEGQGQNTNENNKRERGNNKGRKDKDIGNVISAKQIVPGILVLNTESKGGPSKASQQENKLTTSSSSTTAIVTDGVEKLAYLAKLLEVTVSYSDFPKKNEYLSVVSLSTNPPQVAHGCGASIEEAQNNAACTLLKDLSDTGLDNIKPDTT